MFKLLNKQKSPNKFTTNEERLYGILSGSHVPQFVIDENHTVVYWNRALEELSGIKGKDVIGTKRQWCAFYSKKHPCLADLVVDGTVERTSEFCRGEYHRSKLMQEAYEATSFFPTMGGGGKWLFFSAAAIRNPQGNIIGAVETLEDITERKKTKEELAERAKEREEAQRALLNVVEDLEVERKKMKETEKLLQHERDRAQQYLDVADVMIVVLDREGVVTLINRRGSEILGYSEQEILGKNWFEHFLLEFSRTRVREVFDRLMRSDEEPATSFENIVVTKSGAERLVAFHNVVLRDERGVATGTLSSGDDITEQRAAQQQLTSTLKRLQEFEFAVTNASDHIIITDADGKIIFANKGVERITGYSPEEVIGKTPRVWGGQMPKEFYEKFWHTIKDEKKPFQGEIQNRRKNGEAYTALTSVTPILGDNGNVEFFVGIERDITEQKALDRAKSEFISIASHQLRTPVSALNWLIEALRHAIKHPTAKEEQDIDDLTTMTHRLSKLVESLLNVSRIELGKYTVQAEPADLRTTVEQSLVTLKAYAAEHHHTLKVNFPGAPLTVAVAGNLVDTVLSNLVSNAVNYSPDDSTVTVSVEKEGSFAKISISNTGPAIPKDVQQKLFTKFFRAEATKKSHPEGSGLGLYIVKTFVEKMGGQVGLSSDEHLTAFWFTLPLSEG